MEEELRSELEKYKIFYEIVKEENDTMKGTYQSEKAFLQNYITELEARLSCRKYRMVDKVCNVFRKTGE